MTAGKLQRFGPIPRWYHFFSKTFELHQCTAFVLQLMSSVSVVLFNNLKIQLLKRKEKKSASHPRHLLFAQLVLTVPSVELY